MKILQTIKDIRKPLLLVLASSLIAAALGSYITFTCYKERVGRVSYGMWGKGLLSMKQNDYDHAIYYFSQAIALNKTEPIFYESMAKTFEDQKNIGMAIEFYQTALNKCREQKRDNAAQSIKKRLTALRKEQN